MTQPKFDPKPCHNTLHPVMALGHAKIYAGGSKDIDVRNDWALVINFSGYSDNTPYAHAWGNAGKLTKDFMKSLGLVYKYIPELEIYWGDGLAPDFDKPEWMALIRDISKVKGKVFIHCVGGHGRTGTALAAIAHLANLDYAPSEGLVQWLRTHYCEKAVETTAQCEYLEKLGVANVPKPKWIATTIGYRSGSFINGKWTYAEETPGAIDDTGWCYHCGFKTIPIGKMFQHDATGYGICMSCNEKWGDYDKGTGNILP